MVKIFEAILTVLAGVVGAYVLYFVLNKVAELLPGKWEERIKPYFYVLPAIAIVAIIVLYPTVQTINYSFANADSTAYVGLANFRELLSSSDFHATLFNTLLWMVVAPAATIAVGLVVATLADRLSPRSEKLSKTIIFLPMAIGAVGAATIWKFVYVYSTPGSPQIGLQNAIWTGLGRQPIDWLGQQKLHFNTFELIIILLWLQIGYSMVLLSAAIKGVPGDTVEAARIDGANEFQIFRRVLVPQIRPTIITVFITVLIGVMKIFDLIYVMEGAGQNNTSVIGVQFYQELFTNQNTGHAAAIVVMLMIAVIPVMIYQVRNFRAQEANR